MTDLHFPPKKERHRKFGSVPPIPGDKPTSKDQMPDLQNRREDYWFDLDQVGVSSVKHPILFHSPLDPVQQTPIASLELTTTLSRDAKGINMSRLTEQLERYRHTDFVSDPASLNAFTRELAEAMQQDGATLKLEFPWFYERSAPVSGQIGLAYAELLIEAEYRQNAEPQFSMRVGIRASVTTLCPCSKEISEYSAHNQRGTVQIRAEVDPEQLDGNWCALLLDAAESNASAPLHPVLKRPDEKLVTERAYENPRFVEDLVRLVAADLAESPFIRSFDLECRNEESIHQHDAIARVRYKKKSPI